MEASLARGTRLITTDVFFGIGGPSSLYTIFVCASAISKSKSIPLPSFFAAIIAFFNSLKVTCGPSI